MRAYKGFDESLTSRHGDGINENCEFVPGETKEVENSKTARTGFHCCENPFDCLKYYALGQKNRYFIVEAEGNIDEDEVERIACTKITLVEELSLVGLAREGMAYIINHPDRESWEKKNKNLQVSQDMAMADGKKTIAIARGKDPRVKGPEGSILGILKEGAGGEIIDCKLFITNGQQSNKWIRLTEDRELEVCK